MDAVITIAVIVAAAGGLISNRVSPPSAMLGATSMLFVLGITDVEGAFGGFANSAPLTIAALYIVAGGVARTGAIAPAVDRLLVSSDSELRDMARLLTPVTAASAFLANTPIVAMLVGPVVRWCQTRGRSVSRMLIPISYATILGGTITAIGSSTNLVSSGQLEAYGRDPLAMFELAKFGLPVAIVGLVFVVVAGPRLLPDRSSPSEEVGRSYVVSMQVQNGGPIDGQTVEDAGLRHLQGVFLIEVDRSGRVTAPVEPGFELRGGDRLTFAGRVDMVLDLQSIRGLVSAEVSHLEAVDHGKNTFFEAVVGGSSPLIGHTLAESGFRSRYGAAVVAIHRSGEALSGKLGTIRIHAGDTLLVLAPNDFRVRWRHSGEFLLIARLGGAPPSASRRAPVVLAILALLIVAPLTGRIGVFKSALIAAGLTIVLGVQTPREARDAVDVNVIVTIAAAFGLGRALEDVGIAESLADGMVDLASPLGTLGVVAGVLVATMLLTELVTNAAAIVLVFPVALRIAESSALEPRELILAVTVAASASFVTPIGYQTNTMVYGPGGYRFGDYSRLGLPLSIGVVAILTAVTVNL